MRTPFGGTALLAALFLFPGKGSAGGLDRDKPRFTFTFQQDGDDCRFKGDFRVQADPQVVWGVLTDYQNRSRFVKNVHCRVRRRDGNSLWVAMTVGGGFLFFREEVKGLLKVEEAPLKSLSFNEVSHKNFDFYRGDWTLKPEPAEKGIDVTYRLEAGTNRHTPAFVTPDLLRQTSEDLMTQMRREIMRRELKQEGAGPVAAMDPFFPCRKTPPSYKLSCSGKDRRWSFQGGRNA